MSYKIVILILYTPSFDTIASIVIPNLRRYVLRHGYEMEVVRYPINDYPSDFGYKKLIHIQEIFEDGLYNVVWCLDMDTLITNHKIKVEQFLDDEHDFFVCFDVNGLNAGSFIIKKSKWSELFLDACLDTKGLPGVHCEQDAFNTVFTLSPPPIFEKVKKLPHPSINSYLYENYSEFGKQTHEKGEWEDGDFLLHLPGLSNEKRIEILNNTPIIE